MNQQLKELAQRSGIMFESTKQNRIHSVSTETLEKFAKLIILECDRYARSTWEHGALLGGDLKNLFGVEE